MTNGWPNPKRLGVPVNPERANYHWLSVGGVFIASYWHDNQWNFLDLVATPKIAAKAVYYGPCLTPAEVAALVEDARRSVGVAAANLAVQYVASQISVDYRPTADKLQALEAATDQFLKNIKREDDAEPLINWLQGRANLLVDLRDEVEAARREEREACAVIAAETDAGWFDARTFTAQKIAAATLRALLAERDAARADAEQMVEEAKNHGAWVMREGAAMTCESFAADLTAGGTDFKAGYANGCLDCARTIRTLPLPSDTAGAAK